MGKPTFVVATDRGGHLHNAKMLLAQLGLTPRAILTTQGPEVSPLRDRYAVFTLPYVFSWVGKLRFFNPVNLLGNTALSFWHAARLKPDVVISLGATNVVPFCYWARLFGARVIHVECMNQVEQPSITGRLLYPICSELYVQWQELLAQYGRKAHYAGWVL